MKFNKTICGKDNKEAVVIFPHWKSISFDYNLLSKRLSRKYCVITYNYTKDILSQDVIKTLSNFKAIIKDANLLINQNKYKPITVIGFSLGSYLAFMLAGNKKVSKVIAITSSWSFPYFIWYSNRTRGIKKALIKQKMTLLLLDKKLGEISPANNLRNKNLSIFLVLSESDRIIPYPIGKELADNVASKKRNSVKIYRNLPHVFIVYYYMFKLGIMPLPLNIN